MAAYDLPPWAQRIAQEQRVRRWSQRDTVQALIAHADVADRDRLVEENLLRNWKNWVAGRHLPDAYHQRLIAKAFGTVQYAVFPAPERETGRRDLLVTTGLDTVDILGRLRASDVDDRTLDAVRVMKDQLCSEYPHVPAGQLLVEGRQWLRRVVGLRDHRMTLAQHREVLALAGWLALLVGCVENDTGDRRAAEATRLAAASLGKEADNAEIMGWALEMRAWFALTGGDLRGTVTASDAGIEAAAHHGVAVQLAAQQAKAWARMGDRRQVELALDRGRTLLESQPYPDNLDHHFVVDPAKFDFYAMDCYRVMGQNDQADALAHEVIRASTDFDGTERSVMRIAEARVTLGVSAARNADLELAITYGERALGGERHSLPSLAMVSRELGTELAHQFPGEPEAVEYLQHLKSLVAPNR
jgi:hypothetical protein